jgi:hypothetical protein
MASMGTAGMPLLLLSAASEAAAAVSSHYYYWRPHYCLRTTTYLPCRWMRRRAELATRRIRSTHDALLMGSPTWKK